LPPARFAVYEGGMLRITTSLILAGVLSSCSHPPAPAATPEPPASTTAAAPAPDPCAATAGPDRPSDCPPVETSTAGLSPQELAAVDSDGDHVDDLRDRCPDDPEDLDGNQDDDGCPDLEGVPTTPTVPTSIQAEQHPPRQP